MFTRHRHGPMDRLNCPHAMGTNSFSPQWPSHFVTFCCYHRHRLFTADPSCRIFESALERVRRSYRLYVYGHVVMPEHVHLLLSEPRQDTLADALKLRRLAGVRARCRNPERSRGI